MTAAPELHSVRVARTARYATLGDPDTAESWCVVLHGYGQLAADFIQNFEPLASDERCIIAPEGLSRFYTDGMSTHKQVGASWMTRECREEEIRDYVAALDTIVQDAASQRPQSISVLGFSQGIATASRWAVLGSTTLEHIVLWGGPPAQDIDLETHGDTLRRMTVTLVIGNDDRHVPSNRRETALRRLRRHDIPVSLHTYDGGHRIPADALETVFADLADPDRSD